MDKSILFITTGDIAQIATMKRAIGLAKPLANLGWDVHIVVEESIENRKRLKLECDARTIIHFFNKSEARNELYFKNRLIEDLHPTYIYLCSFSYRNFIKKKKSLLIIEHSELQSSIQNQKLVKRFAAYFFEMYSLLYGDRLVCASRYLYDYFSKLSTYFQFEKTNILYSPYAYNEDVINSPPLLLPELKRKYQNDFICLYMGSMAENYGFIKMLEALKMLQNHANIKLLMLGKGKDLNLGKKYVEKNGMYNVEFLGYVKEEELSSYFMVADVFLSPLNDTIQDWARCPSKIYMYLPFQKPIVTCRIGEAYEIFKENGLYFDYDDSSSLARLIKNIFMKKQDRIHIAEFWENNLTINHSWINRAKTFNNWIEKTNEHK